MKATLNDMKVMAFVCSILAKIHPVVQLVASLIADPEAASSIRARPHTFVTIDHEIFSTVILLLHSISSFHSFMNGCCQLQAKIYALSTCYLLKACM